MSFFNVQSSMGIKYSADTLLGAMGQLVKRGGHTLCLGPFAGATDILSKYTRENPIKSIGLVALVAYVGPQAIWDTFVNSSPNSSITRAITRGGMNILTDGAKEAGKGIYDWAVDRFQSLADSAQAQAKEGYLHLTGRPTDGVIHESLRHNPICFATERCRELLEKEELSQSAYSSASFLPTLVLTSSLLAGAIWLMDKYFPKVKDESSSEVSSDESPSVQQETPQA